MKNYYDILGVAPHASAAVIKAAFKALAQAHHPDKVSGAAREEATARMQEINEAFNVLSDPSRRQDYDEQLQAGRKGTARSATHPVQTSAARESSARTMFKKTLAIFGSLLLALIFSVHEKSMFQRGWDFLSSGFSDNSAYAVTGRCSSPSLGLAYGCARRSARDKNASNAHPRDVPMTRSEHVARSSSYTLHPIPNRAVLRTIG